jgi:hypothetical protein
LRVRASQHFLAKVSRRSARNLLAISTNSTRSACQPYRRTQPTAAY